MRRERERVRRRRKKRRWTEVGAEGRPCDVFNVQSLQRSETRAVSQLYYFALFLTYQLNSLNTRTASTVRASHIRTKTVATMFLRACDAAISFP